MSMYLFIALFFLFGVLVGSFLNVLIYRIPKGESVIFPASHCLSCNTPLKWYHNIPLFSWVFLRGRCTFCGTKISMQYPLIEILGGVLFVVLYLKVGLHWYLPFVIASFCALLVMVMIDFRYMAVPDSVNFAALAFALAKPEFLQAVLDAALAAGGLYAVSLLAALLAKKEAMGGADVIVAGTMGALLGFPNFFVAIFLSALLAIIPSLIKRKDGVPFVPFLALATLIIYIFDSQSNMLIESLMHG